MDFHRKWTFQDETKKTWKAELPTLKNKKMRAFSNFRANFFWEILTFLSTPEIRQRYMKGKITMHFNDFNSYFTFHLATVFFNGRKSAFFFASFFSWNSLYIFKKWRPKKFLKIYREFLKKKISRNFEDEAKKKALFGRWSDH